jgi:hypothetical protein
MHYPHVEVLQLRKLGAIHLGVQSAESLVPGRVLNSGAKHKAVVNVKDLERSARGQRGEDLWQEEPIVLLESANAQDAQILDKFEVENCLAFATG